MKTDVIVYAGQISVEGYELLCQRLKTGKKSDRVLLVLATPGGDPHAGFRIARALQHTYEHFELLVPRFCKSAGTLVALGAQKLYLDDMSELGPLDIQIKKNDEVVGRNSGLDILQAVNYLQGQTLTAFQTYLVGLTQEVGLSTKVASEISSNLTTGLFEPISAQIDPVRLAEMQRATEVAFEYGSRLADKGKNLKLNGLQLLVNGYPSHGFVIDRKEARNIFHNVFKPTGLLAQFSQAVRDFTEEHTNGRQPIIQRLELDLNLDGDDHEEPAHTPDVDAGPEFAPNSQSEIDGDSEATVGGEAAAEGAEDAAPFPDAVEGQEHPSASEGDAHAPPKP